VSTRYKNHEDNQLLLDMSQTLLVEPRVVSIPLGHSELSVIALLSISQFLHASFNGRPRIDNKNRGATENPKSQEPRRILVVDDEKDITMVFKVTLERAGFKVEVFNDPLEALSQFKPHYYDLVLLDIRMPQMSGFELYHELKKKDSEVKGRFISALDVYKEELGKYSLDKEEESIIWKSIIWKPISMRDLVRIIKEELE
jgi:two-component system, OmpR family, response regulator ChvI